jgi:FlaA1/EpsC-like NDP-sugar epimerase
MACLSGTVALAMWMCEGVRGDFTHAWFMDLPVWVTPTFWLLAASRVYVTVWTRARLLDVLLLAFTLVGGLTLSLAIALLIDPASAPTWIVRAMVIGALGHPAVLVVRVFYRFTEELFVYFRNKSELHSDKGRVALYGAGGRCQIFLRERGLSTSKSHDGRVIVGLIDDDTSLSSRWIYGYPVLGTGKDLPQLISRHRLSGIIVTSKVSPESMAVLRKTALRFKLQLTEWSFGAHEVESEVGGQRSVDGQTVGGLRSEGQKAEGGGQTSHVRGRKTEVGGQTSASATA